jgi:hypothetical protein
MTPNRPASRTGPSPLWLVALALAACVAEIEEGKRPRRDPAVLRPSARFGPVADPPPAPPDEGEDAGGAEGGAPPAPGEESPRDAGAPPPAWDAAGGPGEDAPPAPRDAGRGDVAPRPADAASDRATTSARDSGREAAAPDAPLGPGDAAPSPDVAPPPRDAAPPPPDVAPPPPDLAPPPPPLPPCAFGATAPEIEENLFRPKCGACHGAGSPLSKLDLVSEGLAARVVGQPTDGTATGKCQGKTLLTIDDPLGSVFVEKVEAEAPSCGVRMPLGPPLDPGELACVRRWALLVAGGK